MKGHGHKGVKGDAPREVTCDLESQKRAKVLCQTALAAVLEPVDGGAKRSGMGARAAHPKPASERVWAAVPAGSSRTLSAPRAASASAQGRMCSATRTTRKERSRNSASIEKRMKSIVIEAVLVRSSAS